MRLLKVLIGILVLVALVGAGFIANHAMRPEARLEKMAGSYVRARVDYYRVFRYSSSSRMEYILVRRYDVSPMPQSLIDTVTGTDGSRFMYSSSSQDGQTTPSTIEEQVKLTPREVQWIRVTHLFRRNPFRHVIDAP